jgi:hypothetical protein
MRRIGTSTDALAAVTVPELRGKSLVPRHTLLMQTPTLGWPCHAHPSAELPEREVSMEQVVRGWCHVRISRCKRIIASALHEARITVLLPMQWRSKSL